MSDCQCQSRDSTLFKSVKMNQCGTFSKASLVGNRSFNTGNADTLGGSSGSSQWAAVTGIVWQQVTTNLPVTGTRAPCGSSTSTVAAPAVPPCRCSWYGWQVYSTALVHTSMSINRCWVYYYTKRIYPVVLQGCPRLFDSQQCGQCQHWPSSERLCARPRPGLTEMYRY